MTPERWQRIEALYEGAQGLAPAERSSFLSRACADDPSLVADVERLLCEHVSDDEWLGPARMPNVARLLQDAASTTMTGQTLGRYELRALLGSGGMGAVYRAWDPQLDREVAVKILPHVFTSDADRVARFEREARMLAALNHPNICAIYGVDHVGEVRFLILELVEGPTLAETLGYGSERDVPVSALPIDKALAIGRQIVDAFEAAHERTIVHRDLKPANIKVTPDGIVKVLDFGLAKTLRGEDAAAGVTALPRTGAVGGAVMGTAAYMSPEQARGTPVDVRTDIWSFGCVLYEMLTGRLAFEGATVSDTIAKVLEREPDWAALPPATPPSVRRLLRRALVKDPRHRLRDIGDARLELDTVTDDEPAAQSGASTERRTRHAALPVLAALAVVTAAGVAALVWKANPRSVQARLAEATYSYVVEGDGAERDAAISPDGRFVAYLSDNAGPFQVWLAQLGTTRYTSLTTTKGGERNRLNRPVGFSADGTDVWLSGSPFGRRLRLMPFTGGDSRLFLEAGAISVAWSPDGERLVYHTDVKGDAIVVADRTGANARQILIGEPGHHNHYPAWSSDGAWIVYVHFDDEAGSADLYRVRADGGPPERLTEQYTEIRYPTPIDARTVLYVARDAGGAGPWLWALDLESRVTQRVTIGPNRFLSVHASRDARRLVATIGTEVAALWSVPILNRLVEESDVEPYSRTPGRAFAPRLAGDALFYLSSSAAGDGLWRREGDATPTERWRGPLLDPPAIARDGRVAVTLRRKGPPALAVQSADGAEVRSISGDLRVRGAADWSPDGRTLVTGGRDANGPGLFLVPADGGPRVRLVSGQAFDPVWSPDGSLIVYAGPLASGTAPVRAVRRDGTAVNLPPIQTSGQGGGCLRFLPDGTGAVYMLGPTGAQGFWLLNLRDMTTRQLARLSSTATTSTFDISPDGTRIVFDRVRENSDVVLIELPD